MKLYTKTICPKCLYVKDAIERNKLNIEIVNIDHNKEARQVLINNGIMAAPVLEVDGKLITNVSEQLEVIESQ